MPESASLLITGCAGFIGRAVARLALDQGYQVTGLSLNSPDSSQRLEKVTYCAADLSDGEALKRALADRQFDYVINCGGYVDHTPLSDGGKRLLDSHFTGLVNLIQQVNHAGLKRLIQIGSSDEYGGAESPQRETLREQPISPYSLAKVASTHLIETLFRSEGFPGTVARLFLVYGPGQSSQRFIPQVIQGCLSSQSFPVSEGHQLRDFCYIEDAASGILALLDSEEASGEIFNIASGTGVSIREVIETIQHQVGSGQPDYGAVPYRPGENMSLYADISKVRAVTGWKPVTSLASGIGRTIDWFRQRAV